MQILTIVLTVFAACFMVAAGIWNRRLGGGWLTRYIAASVSLLEVSAVLCVCAALFSSTSTGEAADIVNAGALAMPAGIMSVLVTLTSLAAVAGAALRRDGMWLPCAIGALICFAWAGIVCALSGGAEIQALVAPVALFTALACVCFLAQALLAGQKRHETVFLGIINVLYLIAAAAVFVLFYQTGAPLIAEAGGLDLPSIAVVALLALAVVGPPAMCALSLLGGAISRAAKSAREKRSAQQAADTQRGVSEKKGS